MSDIEHELADAFVQLVEEGSFKQASISALAGRMGVSRKTFYRHFSGKADVMTWVFRGDLGRQLTSTFAPEALVFPKKADHDTWPNLPFYARGAMQGSLMNQSEFVSSLIQCMQRHRVYYLKLLDPTGDATFTDYFKRLYTPVIVEDIKLMLGDGYLPRKSIAYLAEYHVVGMLAMLPMQVADNDRFALDGDLNPLLNLTHESLLAAVERHHTDRPPEEENPFYAFDHR